jgi:hypothetical protein
MLRLLPVQPVQQLSDLLVRQLSGLLVLEQRAKQPARQAHFGSVAELQWLLPD